MSTLTEQAQQHIERTMQELSGDDDFMPFMTIRNARDEVAYVGMFMPDDYEEKALLADMMTAVCMVHRGVEATFASVSWVVTCNRMPDVPPSQHPDRMEKAFLITVDIEDQYMMHEANVIRENDMVGVGLWSTDDANVAIEGRFAEAIAIGMRMGRSLPPELGEWFDEEMRAGRLDDIIQTAAKSIYAARKEAFG